MASYSCKNCGAQIDSDMKFCRRCGQPSSMLEAPKQTLEETFDTEGPTRQIVREHTAPEYIVPDKTGHHPAPTTKKLKGADRNRKLAILAGLIFLVAIIAALVLSTALKNPTVPSAGPPGGNDKVGGTGKIDESLIYPGAEVTMETSDRHGRSLQLRTKDSPEKVGDWYIDRVKPKNIVRNGSRNVILTGNETNVVINQSGDWTNVIVNQKAAK